MSNSGPGQSPYRDPSGPALDEYAFRAAMELGKADPPFYALIGAAMFRADSINAQKLRSMWPEIWDDFDAFYNGRM